MNDSIRYLKVAIDALTTPEEIREGYDLLKARSGRLAAVAVLNFNPGDRVSFKGKRNEIVTGKILDVNRKTVTVLADFPAGARWRVAPGLLTLAPTGPQEPTSPFLSGLQPGQPGYAVEAAIARQKPVGKRPESEILKDLLGVFCALSPENLTCDGELPRAEVNRRSSKLNAEKTRLIAELGREIEESEVYRLADDGTEKARV